MVLVLVLIGGCKWQGHTSSARPSHFHVKCEGQKKFSIAFPEFFL